MLRPAVYLAKMVAEKKRGRFEATRQKFLEETLKHASNHSAYPQPGTEPSKTLRLSDFSPVEESYLSKHLYAEDKSQKAHPTSGTGQEQPKYTYYADRPHDWLSAVYVKKLFSRGYRPFQSRLSHTIDESERPGLKQIIFPSTKIDPKIGFKDHIDKLTGHNGWVFTHSNLIFTVAKMVLKHDRELDFSLSGIVTTGSYINQHMKRTIANAFDCKVVRNYGAAERHTMAFGCRESGWYHIHPESGIFEVKTPVGIKSEGKGELVFTSLARREPPLVRMLTGDIVKIKDRTCSCGSQQKSIRIYGRKERFIRNNQEEKLRARAVLDSFCQLEEILSFKIIPGSPYKIEYVPNIGDHKQMKHRIEQVAYEKLGINSEAEMVKHISMTKGGKMPVISKNA